MSFILSNCSNEKPSVGSSRISKSFVLMLSIKAEITLFNASLYAKATLVLSPPLKLRISIS